MSVVYRAGGEPVVYTKAVRDGDARGWPPQPAERRPTAAASVAAVAIGGAATPIHAVWRQN